MPSAVSSGFGFGLDLGFVVTVVSDFLICFIFVLFGVDPKHYRILNYVWAD